MYTEIASIKNIKPEVKKYWVRSSKIWKYKIYLEVQSNKNIRSEEKVGQQKLFLNDFKSEHKRSVNKNYFWTLLKSE